MSRLGELMAELCPDGVEYYTLKELGNFYGGITGKSKDDFIDGNAKFITYRNVYSNPSLNLNVEDKVKITDGENQRTLEYGDVIFTGSSETPNECGISSVITQKTDEKLYLNSFCFVFRFNDPSIMLPDFAKHLFRSDSLRYQICKTASGVTRFNVSKKLMGNVKLPVPPLEVQREIVRILDSFTLFTAELTAELTARKKQYECYRDMLLNFDVHRGGVFDVEWRTLGDVCNVVAGGTPSKKNSKFWANGTIKWLGSTVCQNKKTIDSVTGYITEQGLRSSSAKMMKKGTTLIALVGATIGKIAYLPFEAAINQNIAGVYPKDTTVLEPAYVYHVCKTLYPKFLALIQGSSLAMANLSFVRGLQIPIPSLEVQKRLVNVLDNFEAICTDLNIGLPAEINARQKQYEYYRDTLLTFVEKGKIIGGGYSNSFIKIIQYVFRWMPVKLLDVAEYSKDRIKATDINTTNYIGVDNLLQNKQGKTNAKYVPKEGNLTKYYKGNVLIGNIRPYLRKIWFADCFGGTNGDVLVIRSKNTTDVMLNKFMYYVLSDERFFIYDNNNATGAKMPRGNKNVVMEYEFYLPSIKEQKRIIAILDRFDTLCNDLSTGLPAEINARQKQYEYYRDKLLTFKEKI